MYPGIEKREARRVNYSIDVEIEWGSSTVHGRTRNLSAGGMFVELANPLWIGAEFSARVKIDGSPVQVQCVVRRVMPELGNGVEFADMSAEDRSRLRQLIESLPY